MLALLVLTLSAWSAKVPATINIGIGPTVGTVMNPALAGPAPLSVGVALRAEGWVSKKTLHSKKVLKRVPRKYRGMVRNMYDLHVVPMPVWVVPDTAFLASVQPEADSAVCCHRRAREPSHAERLVVNHTLQLHLPARARRREQPAKR